MKPHMPYDPEDIESLMMHKSFDELYPEERDFVLRHVSGPEEYESMRRMWHELNQGAAGDEWLEPDPAIRKNLLALFPAEKKGGFKVWLNTLFNSLNPPQITWYRRPAVQFAFGLAVLAIAIWIAVPDRQPELAELRKEEKTAEEPAASEEVVHDSLLPQAPVPVEAAPPAVTIITQEELTLADNVSGRSVDNISESISAPEEEPMPQSAGALAKESADYAEAEEKVAATAPTSANQLFSHSTSVESISVKSVDAVTVMQESETVPASTNMNALNGLLDVLYTAR